MNVMQISSSDGGGGAAIAAFRLHKGLLSRGASSRMLVRSKVSHNSSVVATSVQGTTGKGREELALTKAIQAYYIGAHRTVLSDTIFSFAYPGYDVSRCHLVRAADLVNLHWVAGYQSPVTLQSLFATGKPVVWTIHDQWPFTGGCHYSAGCGKYRQDCVGCPQLADDPFGLPQAVLRDKLALFAGANLTIVSPSRWLAECATESRLFKHLRIEVIGNGLDTRIFSPMPKSEAKARVGANPVSTTILVAAHRGDERRKGGTHVVDALAYCLLHPEFANLARSGSITLLTMGRAPVDLSDLGLPVVSLGHVTSEETVSTVYSAADIFLLPSLEDNLPNTMLEAMSCATPVVAFDSGGISDAVGDWVTGRLVPSGDTRALAEAMMSLVFDPDKRRSLGEKSRQVTEEAFSLAAQARRYLALYAELLQDSDLSGPNSTRSADAQMSSTTPGTADLSGMGSPVYLETAMGPHFSAIYDQVLLRALREAVPALSDPRDKLEAENRELKLQLTELHRSRSWRLTAALRTLSRRVRGLRR